MTSFNFHRSSMNTGNDSWGSSIYATHLDAVKSKSNGTELTSINFSKWLQINTLLQDFVAIKMDVEGTEYDSYPIW